MDDLSNPGDAEPRASLTDIHDTIGDPTKDSKDSKLRIGRDISPKQSIANNGAPIRSSRPQTPQRNSNQRNVSISILFPILLAFAFAVFRSSPFSTNSLKILPTSYAICSRSKKIYTIAREGEAVECFVVKAGYVVDVGDLDDIRERWGDLDSWGSLSISVLPGLIDAHGHILDYGRAKNGVDLLGSKSAQEAVERVTQYIKDRKGALPKDEYIEGLGWDQTKWQGGVWPTWKDFDAVPALRGRPIVLSRVDLHACWVSEETLKRLAPIPREMKGGLIMRDEKGDPTGVFLDTAYEWVLSSMPPWTDQQRSRFLKTASHDLLSNGIVGVQDAATYPSYVEFFKKLDDRRSLPFRIYAMVACSVLDEYCGDSIEELHGHRLDIRAVKLFADGALGSWGAAMWEPYSDNPSEKGILRSSPEVFEELAEKWTKKGFQVNIHAIGDRANTVAIDALEKALRTRGESDNTRLRLRIEHAQIMRAEDIRRVGELGLIASMQPTHATSDMGYAEAKLGPERIKGAYAWRSVLSSGGRLALGSDFPVEGVNPFVGIHAAVTRTRPDGTSPSGPGGWYPEQKLTRYEAVRGFTLDAAYASFSEDTAGSIEIGKKADFVVVDRDIFLCDEKQIVATSAKATVIDGRLAWGRF